MSIDVMPDRSNPLSSTRSTIGSTLGCTGITANRASLASRLYMRIVE
jgi:hypothetical protein